MFCNLIHCLLIDCVVFVAILACFMQLSHSQNNDFL